MTSSELRRLADQKIVQSNSLLRDADRLRSQAAALRGLLDPLVAMSQRVWVGPAAADFESRSTTHARIVNDQAGEIVRIAGELESQARELRRESASLRAQAAADASVLPAGVA